MHGAAMTLSKLLFGMLVVGASEACHLGRDVSWFFEKIVDSCSTHGMTECEGVRAFTEHASGSMSQ